MNFALLVIFADLSAQAGFYVSNQPEVAARQASFAREPLTFDGGSLLLKRYDITIRFTRDSGLPTPPNRNTRLDKGN